MSEIAVRRVLAAGLIAASGPANARHIVFGNQSIDASRLTGVFDVTGNSTRFALKIDSNFNKLWKCKNALSKNDTTKALIEFARILNEEEAINIDQFLDDAGLKGCENI